MSDVNSEISPHIDALIDTFVPSNIRESYPALVQFIRAYLDFLETQNQSAYFQNTLPEQRFIETQQEQFLKRIEKEIGLFVPRRYEADPKLFYNKISELWQSRGSPESIKTFFRIFFDEPVEISYPNEQLLIPSNSVWFQESFITLECQNEVTPMVDIKVYQLFREFEILVDANRYERISPNLVRVYSENTSFENVKIGDNYVIREESTDNFICIGEVVPSPANISVTNRGEYWRAGQIIKFPGTDRDTLIRVDSVDENTGINELSIVEHGYQHAGSEILTVSPFPIRPSDSGFNITEEVLPTGGTRFDVLIASENVSLSDSVFGFFDGSYFLEEYVDNLLYVGESKFVTTSLTSSENQNVFNYQISDITIEEWNESRATIVLGFAARAKLEGEWRDLSSIISEEFIRIQDSFFYQTYSYELNSLVNPVDYKSLIPEFNVAGQKPFFNYERSINFDTFVVDISFALPFIEIDPIDFVNIDDEFVIKDVRKQILDVGDIFEKISNNLTKKFSNVVVSNDTQLISVTKNRNDNLEIDENITQKQFEKSFKGDYFGEGYLEPQELYTITITRTVLQDFDFKDIIKYLTDSSDGATDKPIKNPTKVPNDSISSSDNESFISGKVLTDNLNSTSDDINQKTLEKNLKGDFFGGSYTVIDEIYTVTETHTTLNDSAEVSLNGSLVVVT